MLLTSTATDLYDNIKHLIDRGIDGLIIAQYISSPDALNNYLKKHHVPYVVLIKMTIKAIQILFGQMNIKADNLQHNI